MSPTWQLICALAAVAIGIAIAMLILAVGYESEERPGYLDLTGYTGLRPRRGYSWPSVSRPRAQDVPAVIGLEVGFERLTETDRAKLPAHLRSPEAFLAANAELAGLSETELARRVATQQQPRGADAA